MLKAVFPGTFDPITLGHCDVINRAIGLFDEVIVALGQNTTKKSFFTHEQRLNMIKAVFKDNKGVNILSYNGLTIDFCKEINAGFIIRGFRSVIDFEYEMSIANMNKKLNSQIETVCLFSSPEFSHINASIVREIIKMKGDIRKFVPEAVVSGLGDLGI